MAKMFYSVEEAAARLNVPAEKVREMAASGQLQEFRDRDRLMFKVEQVDMLAGKGDEGAYKLAESGELEPLSLASSGSAAAVDPGGSGAKEGTGISIFDPETEEADPSALTRVAPAMQGPSDSGMGGSGGLADSALGSDLLQEGLGGSAGPAAGGGLFEGGEAEAAVPQPMMALAAEAYDGAGSGLVGGLAFGMLASLLLALAATIFGLSGTSGSGLLATLGQNFMALVGGALGLTVLGALIGFVLGRRS